MLLNGEPVDPAVAAGAVYTLSTTDTTVASGSRYKGPILFRLYDSWDNPKPDTLEQRKETFLKDMAAHVKGRKNDWYVSDSESVSALKEKAKYLNLVMIGKPDPGVLRIYSPIVLGATLGGMLGRSVTGAAIGGLSGAVVSRFMNSSKI